jgi:hypothetical protein
MVSLNIPLIINALTVRGGDDVSEGTLNVKSARETNQEGMDIRITQARSSAPDLN